MCLTPELQKDKPLIILGGVDDGCTITSQWLKPECQVITEEDEGIKHNRTQIHIFTTYH